MIPSESEIAPGSVWRQVKLGTEAVYEVVSRDGELVEVRVVHAPGLPAGSYVRFTHEAVRAMERVPTADPPDRDGGGPAQ